MKTRDGSETVRLPVGKTDRRNRRDRRASGRIRLTVEQRTAVEFLHSRSSTTAKVLVGAAATGKTTLLKKICSEVQDHTVLRTRGGAGATHSFIASLLQGAGLHPEQLSRTEQENLLTVYLEHEKMKGKRVLIAVDGAEKLSDEEWAELERLHALQLEGRVALELIIVGRPEIYRHIRSPVDGWRCARTRFHTLGRVEEQTSPDAAAPDSPQEPAQLIISRDGEVMERVSLKARTLIGRNVHNNVCLKHLSVSRHHAVIVETPDGHYVVDLNSKNGLTINGEVVSSAVLRHGDVMALGVYRIKVLAWGKDAHGDPRPVAPSLSATATIRVKQIRENLERSLQGVKVSPP